LENEHFSEHAFQQATTATNSVELQGAYALLYEKVKGLKYGEVCVYHSGSLAAGLHNEQLNNLARLLMEEWKRIQLCQRRLAEGCYDYLAVGFE